MNMRRPQLDPSLDVAEIVLDGLVEHVRLWQADTMETVESLRASRQQVEEHQKRFESPGAVREFVSFFENFFLRRAADFDRALEQLQAGVIAGQDEALATIAAVAAGEERRCLSFRDKWLNRPLPYEDARPILNAMSACVRDQLIDYRELSKAAAHLRPPTPPDGSGPGASDRPAPDGALDRRALFTKFFKR